MQSWSNQLCSRVNAVRFDCQQSRAFAQEKQKISAVSKEQLISAGSKIYRAKCARCHGRKGQGQFNGHDAAPKLRGNYANLDIEEITIQVIRGGAYMPKFDYLSDQDIAAVATYIRNSFGNQLGIANVQEIYELRRQNFQLIQLNS